MEARLSAWSSPWSFQDEVLKIMSVQKQTCPGQQTRFKVFFTIGDYTGHIGLGVKRSKEIATTLKAAAIILANLSCAEGYWESKMGKSCIVLCKVTGHCSSVLMCLIPDPGMTGSILAPELSTADGRYWWLHLCQGLHCHLEQIHHGHLWCHLEDLQLATWPPTSVHQVLQGFLVKIHSRVSVQRTQAPMIATTKGFYIRKIKWMKSIKKYKY